MKTLQDKKKIVLISTISVGIISLIAGVATFCGIYFNTKDYRLLKNNYDIYLNKDNIPQDEIDYTYRSDEVNFFTKIERGYTISLDKIVKDNKDYIAGDYRVDIAFETSAINEVQATNKPVISLSSNDQSIKEQFTVYPNQKITVSEIYFNEASTSLTLEVLPPKENETIFDVSKVGLKFFSYVK